jgi:Na+/H+ antiporter NhaD/arsenite permease-like protein
MNLLWLTAAIFLFTYALIVSERIDRMISALLGGMAMILLGIVDQEHAFESVDWNVIFLLIGMMIIASILKETGVFQWLALQAVRLGKGSAFRVMVILSVVTAVASAILDNVTIVILMAPVTLFVASTLRLSPMPFLISQILASNIGGMATLVGDPPNILIGSAGGIDFLTFLANTGPISGIVLVAFLAQSWFFFRDDLKSEDGQIVDIDQLDFDSLITAPGLLIKALVVLLAVIIGFLLHGALHLEPASIALTGALLLLLWSKSDPHRILQEVEWGTLLFFVGLFVAVEAVVAVGLIEILAASMLDLTGGDATLTTMFILWFSAIASGIVDNIPYTATMIPVVQSLGEVMPIQTLWWALSLGACLGGNFTLVGSAANVVVANMAEKGGFPIGFWKFVRYGAATTVMSLVLGTVYIWVRYL